MKVQGSGSRLQASPKPLRDEAKPSLFLLGEAWVWDYCIFCCVWALRLSSVLRFAVVFSWRSGLGLVLEVWS